ncbi:MAG: hypothetical protein CVU18_16530 [Betaproteobacteria bacterium HGW-Betaproteobacteria-12]|nr:MAG: hypothetical protein CVU18_16530 [Betaproteobacteria bacterium HGW-Betaproteobacteria-12]
MVAKAAVLFTVGKYALIVAPDWFPSQWWLLKPLVWVAIWAALAYLVIAPFVRVVQPELMKKSETTDP